MPTKVAFGVRSPAEFGGALMVQQAWRGRRAQATKHHKGWLFKTASGGGPIERLREANQELEQQRPQQQQAAGLQPPTDRPPPISLTELPPPLPRFSRWFVLDGEAATMSIYTTEADHSASQPPKRTVDNLRDYAVLRLTGTDGRATLALLPRSSQHALGRRNGLPRAVALPRPGTQSAPRAEEHALSWYLRAADDTKTLEWCRKLRRAGAASELEAEDFYSA